MNQITIFGVLTLTPKINTNKNGTTYSSFTIADSFVLNGKNKVNYYYCNTFDTLILEKIDKYCEKGTKVLATGYIYAHKMRLNQDTYKENYYIVVEKLNIIQKPKTIVKKVKVKEKSEKDKYSFIKKEP